MSFLGGIKRFRDKEPCSHRIIHQSMRSATSSYCGANSIHRLFHVVPLMWWRKWMTPVLFWSPSTCCNSILLRAWKCRKKKKQIQELDVDLLPSNKHSQSGLAITSTFFLFPRLYFNLSSEKSAGGSFRVRWISLQRSFCTYIYIYAASLQADVYQHLFTLGSWNLWCPVTHKAATINKPTKRIPSPQTVVQIENQLSAMPLQPLQYKKND